ncbi:MAG: LacI family DNA-binding transcriptional regulator [Lachnospiraceae bacterium]|jgi:DNA-binding LacI/PurR family transcriptional regulator|nr:LacI family DNA-binding transcriptional regulator [Lachnospiraceae bacterium]
MAKNVTMADIASKVGVSIVAVSKALSGKPGVSDELRFRIKQVAQQLGYVQITSTKPGVTETGNIGVLIPEHYYGYSFSFYGQMYEKVVRALYNNKYYGILELIAEEDEKEGNPPQVLIDDKVDGLILLGPIDENYIEKIVRQTKLPVFFLDTYSPAGTFDTVISNGYYGMYMVTNYLISQGHKKIGFVGNVDATNSITDRYWGYRRALRENNLPFEESWEIPDRDETGKIFEKILDSAQGMDAYACNCDFAARYVIQNLEEMGFRVPEDVSVVGYDHFLPVGMEAYADRITTYQVDMEQMAEVCVRSLINKIKHIKYTEGIQIVTGRMVLKKTVKNKKQP